MSELLALGASHKTAPLALRERLALTRRRGRGVPARAASPHAGDPARRSRSRPATAPSSTSSSATRSRPRRPSLGMLARQARASARPSCWTAIYSLRNCDAARHLYRVASGLESMVVGEAEVQGQVKRAYELALAARTTGPLTNQLFRAALATGKRVRTRDARSASGARASSSVAVDARARRARRPAAAPRADHRRGRDGELTAQALHEHGVATMFVANRRRERAIALAQRFGGAAGVVRRAARRARARRHRRRLHLLAARAARRRGAGRRDGRARRAAAAADRPRRAARHRRRRAATLPGVTLLDIDELQAGRAPQQLGAPGRGARTPRASSRRRSRRSPGWLGSLEVLPTLSRAARARRRRSSSRSLAENAGRWECAPSATASASRRSRARRQPAAARADAAHEAAERRAPRAAAARCASCSGSRRRAGVERPGEAGRGPPAAAAADAPPDAADRHPRQRAGAGAGARGGASCWAADAEIVEITHGRRPRRAARRQVALGRRAGGGAAGRRDRPRGALGQGRAGRAAGRARRSPPRRARADPRDVLVRRGVAGRRCARARGSGRARCAGARSCWPLRPDLEVVELRGNVDTRLRKLRGGRGRRARARRRRAWSGSGRATRPARCWTRAFVPAAGQGELALAGARGRRAARAAAARDRRRARRACLDGRAGRGARAGGDVPHAGRRARGRRRRR